MTVRTEVALVVVLLSVTDEGLNEQVRVETEGLQVKAIIPLNPTVEEIVNVEVPEPLPTSVIAEPGVIVKGGVTVKARSLSKLTVPNAAVTGME